MTRVALVWIVYSMTGSSEALGVLLLLYTGPVVVGGFLAGSLLDRFDRRVVIICDNLIRGAAVAGVPLLNALHLLSLWEVYAVASVYGFFYMITLAGGPSIVPDLVPQENLATANSLETLAFTISGVVGPPVAGLLILQFGAPNVMIIDATSYAVFVLAMTRVTLPPRSGVVVRSAESTKAVQQSYRMKDVLQLVVSNKILLSITLMFMAFNVGEGFLSVLLPILSTTFFSGGAGLYGILLGLLALGEIAGAVMGGSLTSSRFSLGRLICVTQGLSGASVGLLLLGRNLWITATGLILLGVFSSPLTIWAQTLRMKIIPERMRGRTFALLRTLMQGSSPSGSVIAGYLLPSIGLLVAIGLSAGLIGIPGAFGLGVKQLGEDSKALVHEAGKRQ